MNTDRNIALVGFMGTGKTTIGNRLAEHLHMTFLDMDTVIEEREEKPITRIFAEDGEPHFRLLERKLAQELAEQTGLVIGTGGGIVLNPANIDDLGRKGLVVCLTATPETILERVKLETHRPLLAVNDQLGRIRELLARRQDLYDAVPNQIATDGLNIDAVVARILDLYTDRPTLDG